MKKAFVVAAAMLLMLFSVSAAKAQEVSQAEKDRALRYLETTKKNIEEATKGLSEAQWNFKSAPDRWSVAEVVEHIAAAEDFLRSLIQDKVMKAPAVPGRDLKKTDEAVVAMIPDRTQKAKAPEPLVPSNRFGSPEGSLKHFAESRAATEAFLKSTPDLRQHAIDSPLQMKLDAYQWVLFIAAHSERHTKQLNEVKADPNFPKS